MRLLDDKTLFYDLLVEASYESNRTIEFFEKDYYVTEALRELFSSTSARNLLFKGGTSLSKGYKIISRFSEDIDLTTDIAATVGIRRRISHIITSKEFLKIATLRDREQKTQSHRSFNRYFFDYLPQSAVSIIDSTVQIETSFLDYCPYNEKKSIRPMIAEVLSDKYPELVDYEDCTPFIVKCQALEKTFADKTIALCDYYIKEISKNNREKSEIDNHSRHIYDIHKIFPLVEKSNRLKEVIEFTKGIKSKRPEYSPSLHREESLSDILMTIIKNDIYKKDYISVTSGLLYEKVDYETAVTALMAIAEQRLFDL